MSQSESNTEIPMPVPEHVGDGSSSQQSYDEPTPLSAASLYVGELDPSVTEAMLYELFKLCGAVASIRVCRDSVTRRSLGYAYVNYLQRPDAERAISELNYTEIKGRACRIMWSQRDPSLRKTGSGNIFIKNLDESIDNKALHDTFASFGKILSCKVATDREGNSKGYGFVHYEKKESAEEAISKVDGMLLMKKKVFVGMHVPRRERMSKLEEMQAKFTNVYVKNIALDVTEEQFREHFTKYGAITSAVITTDEKGESRGFGFVNYEDHESAKKATEELHDTDFHGQKLFVSRAQKKQERERELRSQYEQALSEKRSKYQNGNIFIKNFDDDIDDEKLRQEFSIFGMITSAKVMRDEKGNSRGFGFVCYSNPDEANKAISEMNNRMWGTKPIYVALHQRKEERSRNFRHRAQPGLMYQQIPGGFVPPNAAGYPMPAGYPAPNQFPHPSMPRPMDWPVNGQPGAVPPYPGMPPHYQNPGRHMGRPPRSRNPGQRGGRGGPRGASRGSHFSRNPRSMAQHQGGSQAADATGDANPTEEQPAKLTAASLAAASDNDQKQMLGEVLYPKIQDICGEQDPGKITGMLLEMDNGELLALTEDDEALKAKVDEAISVLTASEDTKTTSAAVETTA
ncbi:Protein phosphatase PP2A regulatory subunit B [Mycoemilia scoparia]|uniref:Polyadenylate-binding protein n=1 Tax=Mycoemilia scoparia TaxID=417184 RepID=A0A9W8A403_9FUNG|nr:Protein phosphatase PP2A regulatory subunit B [Mycoemilia scoparia]